MKIENTTTDYTFEYRQTIISNLGIEFQPSEQTIIIATMPVDDRTSHPFGYLSGGASLALAEIIAGHGSRLLCSANEFPCGMQVSGNHLAPVPIGGTVIGKGQIIHKGRAIHVWNIDIFDNNDTLISTARVTNYIIKKR